MRRNTNSTEETTRETTDDEVKDQSQKNNGISENDVNVRVVNDGSTESRPYVVPLSVQSMITQTDRTGKAIKLANSGYDNNDNESSSTRNGSEAEAEAPHMSSRLPFFQRLFCCGRRALSSKQYGSSYRSEEAYGSSEKEGVRNKLQSYGVRSPPQRMPEMSPPPPFGTGKKCLALDLDETLVHSSFQPVDCANYVIPVTIDNIVHNVFVIKRPGVDDFMRRVGEVYEVVVYTASLSKYADPLLDELDVHKVISKRLFRENCVFHQGHYVKDLSLLNRDLSQTIIVDNSPMSYIFQPENAIDCGTFIDDLGDIELWQLADFLLDIKSCDDVRSHCRQWRDWCRRNPSTIPAPNLR